MIFCGQCGLQLAPDSTSCPRCGAVSQPEFAIEDIHAGDPTVATLPYVNPVGAQPNIPQPQKLVLRPSGSNGLLDEQAANEQTSAMNAPTTGVQTPRSPSNPNMGNPYTSYEPQDESPPQRAAYAGFAPSSGMDYQPLPSQYGHVEPVPLQQPVRNEKGRIVGLLLILLGLLLILSAMIVFIAKPALIF